MFKYFLIYEIYLAYVAKSLAGEETYEYAAVFTLGKAKCESMSGKSLAEAAALMEAGRLFARAEENLQTTSAFSSGEFLENALSCFLKAAKVCSIDFSVIYVDI